MNIQDYIDSGVLHDYVMDLLTDQERAGVESACARHPEIKEELVRMQESIRNFAEEAARNPAPVLQESIWNTLENINKEKSGDISAGPVINKYSDYQNWKRIVAPYMPKEITSERVTKVIRHSGGVTQVLIISTTDVEEEVHEHERESFIILEGECECYIGDEVIRLGPGGFVEIPLYVSHNVKILSPHVVAVLQHVAL
ncbi:MAG: hypothetical protein JWQ38_3255 [Flavipsychrobacter sp.]|nr:hypothetical protein [Flavipsychrobacter sp.]